MKEYFIKEYNAYMRYQDFYGENIPLLFIHGLGCAGSFDYPEVIDQPVLKNHRRITVDLLGAGYSDKPSNFPYTVNSHAEYLKTFIKELDIEKFIIFGHSLGGAIAIQLALLCDSAAAQLILGEANLDSSKKGALSYSIAQYEEDDFIRTGFQRLIHENSNGKYTLWTASFSRWLPLSVYRLSKNAAKGGNPSWRKTLYDLPIPKSFIFGEQSLPNQDYNVLREKGIHIEVVKDAGHSMTWENPKGLAAAIAAGIAIHC